MVRFKNPRVDPVMKISQAHKVRGSPRTKARGTARADDLLGAVVPANVWEILKASAKSDLSNVIPFSPHFHTNDDEKRKIAPALTCAHETRPCPFPINSDFSKLRRQWLLLVLGSMLAHAGFSLWFLQPPPPQASIGMEVVSVEMVLGAHTEAGTATTHGPAQHESAHSPDLGKPDASRTELAAQQPVREDHFKPQMQMTPSPELRPEPELAVDPDTKPVPQTLKDRPRETEKKPLEDKSEAARQKIAAASQASVAASGIGVGRSDLDTNYRGLVIAHLGRHKKFPAEAQRRNKTGSAFVAFTIDGDGVVTSASLANSSGNASLDREALAMVHRASPFPAPPSGKPVSFSAPIRFNLR